MSEGVYRRGSVVRLTPTIYKTVDGQVIVEDEFLNFLAVKMKTMTKDEIVLIASNTFGSKWIESSRKVLFELCPETTQRCVAFKGNQKDANNIKSCLKVLNECGEDIPRFVSHYLDALPPVTCSNHSNLDVSYLLSKIECLHSEVCALRRAGEVQAEIGEDLRIAVATMDSRVAAVEGRLRPTDGDPTSVGPVAAASNAKVTMDLTVNMLGGKSFLLKVPHEDTVGSLKKLIQQKLGVATQRQKLVFVNGLTVHLNDDSKPVCSYGLESGSQVSLLVTVPVTIQVFLRNCKGAMSTYNIIPDETVSHFKSRLEEREKVPVRDQRLIHQSKEMTHGKLSDYNVEPMSTINMMIRLRCGGDCR